MGQASSDETSKEVRDTLSAGLKEQSARLCHHHRAADRKQPPGLRTAALEEAVTSASQLRGTEFCQQAESGRGPGPDEAAVLADTPQPGRPGAGDQGETHRTPGPQTLRQ